MITYIERLIQQLDDSTGPSYDARAELIDIGSDAIPAIINGLPSLGGFGQLTARGSDHRRYRFRERLGDLLLPARSATPAAYSFPLARLGTHADAEILTAYLDGYLPRTGSASDQPAALGGLLRLDAHLWCLAPVAAEGRGRARFGRERGDRVVDLVGGRRQALGADSVFRPVLARTSWSGAARLGGSWRGQRWLPPHVGTARSGLPHLI